MSSSWLVELLAPMNRLIHAQTLTKKVNVWLATSHDPQILHIFDRACNLLNERREVLSMVTPEIGNGPFNVVVKDDVYFSEHLHLESPISVTADELRLGHLTINTTQARVWNPRPAWEMLHAQKSKILHQLGSLQTQVLFARRNVARNEETHALARGAGVAMGGKSPPLATTSAQLPITNCQSLLSSLRNSDLPAAVIAAQKLAGLGIGLTPSGDDFLMGAIYAAWMIHPPEVTSVLAKAIADIAAPLTTSLSASWLRAAGKGEAGILWHEFFKALTSGHAHAIQLQMTQLLSIGHTSGADALAGFLSVFQIDRAAP
jgi:hypothetical protein